jgi:hypothetical protein
MASLSDLNSYSSNDITFTVDTTIIDRELGESFTSPVLTWQPVRQLGSLTGSGIQITYDVSATTGATVTFPNSAQSNNSLTITNPSTGVYVISGILDVVDYNAAQAVINPPVAFADPVDYSATYENTNSAASDFVVAFSGVIPA